MTSAKRTKTSISMEQDGLVKSSSPENEPTKAQNAQTTTSPKTMRKSVDQKKPTSDSSKPIKKVQDSKSMSGSAYKRSPESHSENHTTAQHVTKGKSANQISSSTSSSAISSAKKTPPLPKPVKESHSVPKKDSHPKQSSGSLHSRKTFSIRKSGQKNHSKPLIQFPTTTWGVDSIISFEATEHLPPPELTSIAGGFVFHGDSVLLANIPGRGWEVIGGRIDLGETPEETFRRESMSQIGVELSHIKMIGIIRIEHLGDEPPNCPYPFPVGYGIQYIGIADELRPFSGSDESLGRSLISYEGFKEHYYDWNEYYEAVFGYACTVYKKWRKKLKP